jgi:hypothetical protein
MNEKKQRQIMEAASRHNVDRRKRFLVANNGVQGWSVSGYTDLKIAWELACSLAKEAVKWGYPEVYVLARG